MKLLVLSVVEMSDTELSVYSKGIKDRINISPEEFIKKLKDGEQLKAEFQDGTITTYELINEVN